MNSVLGWNECIGMKTPKFFHFIPECMHTANPWVWAVGGKKIYPNLGNLHFKVLCVNSFVLEDFCNGG